MLQLLASSFKHPALLLLFIALSSCSLTLDLEECADDDDCEDGLVCSPDLLCTRAMSETLIGGPCQQLLGAAEDENPFLIGVILQLSESGGGFGRPMLNSIELAMNDINGIGGIDGRRIGLIACDTQGRDSLAREGAEHLVRLGVPAIIGMNSSQVIDIGPQVTVPAKTLLISPSATATTISNLSDDGLIWRTAPSDEFQAQAMAELVNHILTDIFPDQEITEPKITLLVRRQDRWATGLRDHLVPNLPSEITGGGEDRFSVHNFANIGNGEVADYVGVAADIGTEDIAPDLVLVLGSADSWDIIDNLEIALQNKPIYIGGDAMKNADAAQNAAPSLNHRVWGTGPRNVAELGYTPYLNFRTKFRGEFQDDPDNYQFVANAFDALYALAFAAAAQGFTGPDLASGLRRLNQGEAIEPTASDAQRAIQILQAGDPINFAGASGPINFNENGDPEPMPIALWCLEEGRVPEHGELFSLENGFNPLTCLPADEEG